jgi:TldD protein
MIFYSPGMNLSRRRFLKTTGAVAGGLAATRWCIDAAVYEPGLSSATKNELADITVGLAKELGATYGDIRINRYRTERISTRERQVQNVSLNQTFGAGVRVLVNGSWGFAASSEVTPDEVRRVTREAVDIAKANASHQRKPIWFLDVPAVQANWRSVFEQDPFEVSIEEKIETLLKINEAALGVKGVAFVNSSMAWVNEQKFYASTDGSRIEQFLIRGMPEFTVTAVDRAAGDFQTRTSLGGPQGVGYEYLRKHDWVKESTQAGEEAVAKLKAKRVAPGKYDLILHPSHLWLTIHESVGHSTELDRALWWEANFAGTSFLTPDKIGKLQFAAKQVNFFADRTQPAGLATVGYDDEGVPGQKWYLVKDGLFVDWQTTRDLAPLIGRKESNGCLHAQSWSDVPFPRMPNVSLEPAKEDVSLDQLVSGVDNGILIYGNGSFSIDQQRYNFQFGGQTFWEIKQGKITGMLRDVAYQSRTTDFWNSCDGLGGQSTYALGGTFNDGKGEPSQSSAVSHGCPVARFRNVNVLNTDSRHSPDTGTHVC